MEIPGEDQNLPKRPTEAEAPATLADIEEVVRHATDLLDNFGDITTRNAYPISGAAGSLVIGHTKPETEGMREAGYVRVFGNDETSKVQPMLEFIFTSGDTLPITTIIPDRAELAREICLEIVQHPGISKAEQDLALFCLGSLAETIDGYQAVIPETVRMEDGSQQPVVDGISGLVSGHRANQVVSTVFESGSRGTAYQYDLTIVRNKETKRNGLDHHNALEITIDDKTMGQSIRLEIDQTGTATVYQSDKQENNGLPEVTVPDAYQIGEIRSQLMDRLQFYTTNDEPETDIVEIINARPNTNEFSGAVQDVLAFYDEWEDADPGSTEEEMARDHYLNCFRDVKHAFEKKYHLTDTQRDPKQDEPYNLGNIHMFGQSLNSKLRNMLAVSATYFYSEQGLTARFNYPEPDQCVLFEYTGMSVETYDIGEHEDTNVFVIGYFFDSDAKYWKCLIPLNQLEVLAFYPAGN